MDDASSLPFFEANEIDHVLNATKTVPFGVTDIAVVNQTEVGGVRIKPVTMLRVPVEDLDTENISKYFDSSIKFIDQAKSKGGKILVHCAAGISRSATLVIAYLMYSYAMSFSDAYAFVKKRRDIVDPNMGFIVQLSNFDDALKISRMYA